MGRDLIVYYSWTGNTEAVAREIQAETGFEIQTIAERKERPKGKMIGPAMGGFFGLASRIRPMDFALRDVDRILLGAQLWATKSSSPVNAYLKKANFKGKKVWLFLTKGDPSPQQKAIDSIVARIAKRGGTVVDCIAITVKAESTQPPDGYRGELHTWLVENNLLPVKES